MTRSLYIGYDAEMKSIVYRLRPICVALLLAICLWIPQGCGAASMHKAMSEAHGPITWPSHIQRIQVIRAASHITYSVDEEALPNDTMWLRDMRDQIARGLETTSSTQGAPLPIRFRIVVEGRSENVFFSECLGFGWFYWGCPNTRVWAAADIVLDIDGKLYHGAGRAESEVHALWYNQGDATDSEMAAYLAIVEATRAALGSTPHAHLITSLERQVALITPKRPAKRRAP